MKMSRLCSMIRQLIFAAMLAALAACGAQPSKQDVETSPESAATDQNKTGVAGDSNTALKSESSESKAMAEEPRKEPEPPAVETIPRKELGEPDIAIEPLPVGEVVAEDESKPKNESTAEVEKQTDVVEKMPDAVPGPASA